MLKNAVFSIYTGLYKYSVSCFLLYLHFQTPLRIVSLGLQLQQMKYSHPFSMRCIFITLDYADKQNVLWLFATSQCVETPV